MARSNRSAMGHQCASSSAITPQHALALAPAPAHLSFSAGTAIALVRSRWRSAGTVDLVEAELDVDAWQGHDAVADDDVEAPLLVLTPAVLDASLVWPDDQVGLKRRHARVRFDL